MLNGDGTIRHHPVGAYNCDGVVTDNHYCDVNTATTPVLPHTSYCIPFNLLVQPAKVAYIVNLGIPFAYRVASWYGNPVQGFLAGSILAHG